MLSRVFGLALLLGIIATGTRRRGTLLAVAIALALWTPFLWWNAQHHWASFAFSFVRRHELRLDVLRPLYAYAVAALAFSPGLWIATTVAAVRPRFALLAWTALPLGTFVLLLALRERVEIYWFIGPFISLCVAVGCAYASVNESRAGMRYWVLAPAAGFTAVLFLAGIAPLTFYGLLQKNGLRLSTGGPFEMFTYAPLSQQVARTVRHRRGIAMSDGYGLSSLLDFYGGLEPVVVGYDAQGQEARRWFTGSSDPQPALFVDKVPLDARPDFMRQLRIVCRRVTPGPTFTYRFSHYYTTWCEGVSAQSVAMLRW
jgi:hypothetical protein